MDTVRKKPSTDIDSASTIKLLQMGTIALKQRIKKNLELPLNHADAERMSAQEAQLKIDNEGKLERQYYNLISEVHNLNKITLAKTECIVKIIAMLADKKTTEQELKVIQLFLSNSNNHSIEAFAKSL